MVKNILKSNTILVIVCIAISTLVSSCGWDGLFCTDESLHIPLEDYNGTQLRMDGYYYTIHRLVDTSKRESKGYNIFWRDGKVFKAAFSPDQTFAEREEFFLDEEFQEKLINQKRGWGKFKIKGDKLWTERWSTGGVLCHKVFVIESRILNDTTFLQIQLYTIDNVTELNENMKKGRQLNDTFFFRKFPPKIDSNNIYIN